MDRLPSVLLSSLLHTYLLPPEIAQSMSVSREWHQLMSAPLIWSRTFHRYWPMTAMMAYLARHPHQNHQRLVVDKDTSSDHKRESLSSLPPPAKTTLEQLTIRTDNECDDTLPESPPVLIPQLSTASADALAYPYRSAVAHRYHSDLQWHYRNDIAPLRLRGHTAGVSALAIDVNDCDRLYSVGWDKVSHLHVCHSYHTFRHFASS
jgi:hypothetical protein